MTTPTQPTRPTLTRMELRDLELSFHFLAQSLRTSMGRSPASLQAISELNSLRERVLSLLR